MSFCQSIFDPSAKQRILVRLQALQPDAPRRWGTMSAPQMIAHLSDQMRHALGLSPVAARLGPLRWAWVRWATIYLVPWPKGRIKGPPEAFLTQPTCWQADLAELEALLHRFAARGPEADWPEHALLGSMTGHDWGVFAHKHIDYHLRQFGA